MKTYERLYVRVFLSTLSLRRATRLRPVSSTRLLISIHALLAESDGMWATAMPCGMRFLSTLSLRRATTRIAFPAVRNVFLSTLSLRRATDDKHRIRWYIVISIHALLAESDRFTRVQQIWRAISIHALLAESDQGLPHLDIRAPDFYPRSPCGERRRRSVKLFRQNYISIHALLAESDETIPGTQTGTGKFLSTLSLRRATRQSCTRPRRPLFLSTLSLRRAT